MRGGRVSARLSAVVLSVLVCLLSLACFVPSLVTRRASPTATPTATPPPTPTQAPTGETVTRITEEELNRQLQSTRPDLGEGVECKDVRVEVHKTGITLFSTVTLAQFAGAEVPIEVRVMPTVREERVHLEVLEVNLGGPYAAMSSLITPLLNAGLAEGLGAESGLVPPNLRVMAIELEEGYLEVTTRPRT
ncbi:MAG: hypothetical protein K6V36_04680 [Anaerolineae bacterium]|nr:hypothetical protein [Anaerolineae bacterium]